MRVPRAEVRKLTYSSVCISSLEVTVFPLQSWGCRFQIGDIDMSLKCNYAYGSFCRGEIVEIDTWVGASGKNGMRRDWLIRSQSMGHIYARGTR